MRRTASPPRPDWPQVLDDAGVRFHSSEGAYWREDVCYRFEEAEVLELERATEELHAMCLQVVDDVIARDRFADLHIPPACRDAIRRSWDQDAPSLYGRFDLWFDGRQPPRMLEYNADTPTSLIEASVAQWHWLETVRPDADQFNSIHDKLVARWRELAARRAGGVYLAGLADHQEDAQTVSYLEDTARQAGVETRSVPIDEIGWDQAAGQFVDQVDRPIGTLFKLYP